MAELGVVIVNIFHRVGQRFRHAGWNQRLGLGFGEGEGEGEGEKLKENVCLARRGFEVNERIRAYAECVGGHRPNNHFSISGHVSFQHLHLPGVKVFLCCLDPILMPSPSFGPK